MATGASWESVDMHIYNAGWKPEDINLNPEDRLVYGEDHMAAEVCGLLEHEQFEYKMPGRFRAAAAGTHNPNPSRPTLPLTLPLPLPPNPNRRHSCLVQGPVRHRVLHDLVRGRHQERTLLCPTPYVGGVFFKEARCPRGGDAASEASQGGSQSADGGGVLRRRP